MFKRTKRRLVIYYALVFFILQNIFGGMIYGYTRYNLYRQVDHALLEEKNQLQANPDIVIRREKASEREEGHELVYLLWDRDRDFSKVIPSERTYLIHPSNFLKYVNSENLQTVRDGQNTYRIANLSVSDDSFSIQMIQILYKINREKEMLKYLLVIIEIGSIISVFLSIMAGFYLANKALIPIKSTWDKHRQFVADASHELRTPLSVSKLNLEHLFRRPNHTIEQESETVNQVIQEVNYMTKMTEDLLTLTRSDSNQIEILTESLQLDQILQRIVKSFTELATLKNIEVMAEISSIPMMGDKERLKQLFIIILDNALKYTKENGTITLKAGVKNSNAMIEISDTGIGISSEDLPHIFDRFYRGDKSRNRRIEGTGLGLSIANWIVQSHRGKIHVKSKVGIGTTVLVNFPLKIK